MTKRTNQWGAEELNELFSLYRKGSQRMSLAKLPVPEYNLRDKTHLDRSLNSSSSHSKILHCSFLNIHRKT